MTIRKDGFRVMAAAREYARQHPIHTIVGHRCVDLELVGMFYLVDSGAGLRQRLGIVDHPSYKFINSGPLRAEDWRELGLKGEPTAAEIEKRGHLFLDCGGGRFDSHGKETGESSLDLLVNECHQAIIGEKPWLRRPIGIISDNDRSGQDIAPAVRENDETPHTRRHLRKLVDGLNLLHPDDPSGVIALMNSAFAEIDLLAMDVHMAAKGLEPLRRWIDQAFGIGSVPTGVIEECLDYPGSVFDVDLIIEGLLDQSLENGSVEDEYENALDAVEAEWIKAEADFNDRAKTTVRRITNPFGFEINGKKGPVKEITVVAGRSDSPRYGEIARSKAKAEVVIQLYSDGKFLVYSKGHHLGKVAAAIRKIDLARHGVPSKELERAPLARTGHFLMKDTAGNDVESIYFAEYGKACGNAFRTNPLSPACAIGSDELLNVVICSLISASAPNPGRADSSRDHRDGFRRGHGRR